MRHAPLPYATLLPVQEDLDLQKVRSFARHHTVFSPIIALPYRQRFLILDGHHRAAAAYLRGERHVASLIVESDADLRVARQDAAGQRRHGIAGLVTAYEQEWRAVCAAEGVVSFYDLLQMNGLL